MADEEDESDEESLDSSQDLFSSTWKGFSLKGLTRVKKAFLGGRLRPEESSHPWDEAHVRMPFSREALQPKIHSSTGKRDLRPKWSLIKKGFEKSITQGSDLEDIILTYNLPGRWNLKGLTNFVDEELSEEESIYFMNVLLPGMQNLVLRLPEILRSPLPLLKKGKNNSVTLTQTQISSLLANAFFCTYPRRNAVGKRTEYSNFPDVNFNRLFEPSLGPQQPEKLKCVFNYFRRRLSPEANDGLVTYVRRSLPLEDFPDWAMSTKTLPRLHINSSGCIENDGAGLLQVDFANSMIGGGILGHGCVQEEIRFLICPELIVSRLFVERLEDNECLLVNGFERYNDYEGYASTFKFNGNYVDHTSVDYENKHRKSFLIAIDALKFSNSEYQYTEKNIRRELNKAYVGFYFDDNVEKCPPTGIATGNWGCGAFGGDPQLKSIIQLMAAGQARKREVAYFTFGDEDLRDSIYETYKVLSSKEVTIGKIYQRIVEYVSSSIPHKRKDILDYLQEMGETNKNTLSKSP